MRRGIALGVGSLLALVSGFLVLGRGGRTGGDAGRDGARGEPGAPTPTATAELVAAAAPVHDDLEPSASVAASARRRDGPADDAPRRPRTRAPIRGQLFVRDTQDVLDEVLTIRVRTADLSLAETVESAPDGSFKSAVAFPRGFLLVQVLLPAGDPAGEHELRFEPDADVVREVPVPWPTLVRGRLVDRAGEPLGGVEIAVAQPGSGGEQDGGSAEDGTFVVYAARGPCRLHFARGLRRESLTLVLARGPNELGDVVLPFGGGSEIGGVVLALDGNPAVRIELVALEAGASIGVDAWTPPDEGEGTRFLFTDVPSGEYRLTVLGDDGRRYEPAGLRVSPPALGLEFRAAGEPVRLAQRFTGPDGETVDALAYALVNGRWREYEGFAPDAVERWIVTSEEFGATEARLADGVLSARFAPGGCTAYVFVTAGEGGAPFAGAEALVDGHPMARSDASGLLLVRRAEGQDLRFQYPSGWTLHSAHGGAPVWMTMVPE